MAPARKRKRSTAREDTVAAVGADVWLHICAQLAHAPHAVFRLAMCCRSTQRALREAPPDWWYIERLLLMLLHARLCA